MPRTFQRCDSTVSELAVEILCEYESHKPLLDAKVRIDYVFAYNDSGHALTHGGYAALGLARKIGLKDRALGRGDAEIALDGEWWKNAKESKRRALLDHELHHLSVQIENGAFKRDDLGRPMLELRKHDHQFGWFNIIAERHGASSIERIAAKSLWDEDGQLYFPDIFKMVAV